MEFKKVDPLDPPPLDTPLFCVDMTEVKTYGRPGIFISKVIAIITRSSGVSLEWDEDSYQTPTHYILPEYPADDQKTEPL